jgi:hypothetical protein
MMKLERVLLMAFVATLLWIAAGWMRPKPIEVKPPPVSSTHGTDSAASAAAPARNPASGGERAVPRPPARTVRSPFADQPGAFAIDPFADGGPAAVAVFPEPPKPQLPPEERDVQVQSSESE